MIQIYNSCRNVIPNLKFFTRYQRTRSISLGKASNCSKNDDKHVPDKEKPKSTNKNEYPEEPTTCCMSGCANCVWLEYAEKLSEYYKDGGEKAIKEINEKVTDPNVKAFLLHELRMRKK